MISAFLLVIPVFALIFAGWLAGRTGVLGSAAAGEINRFVVWLALPAMLFDIIASAHWSELWQPGFIAVFTLSGLLAMTVAMAVRFRGRRNLADAAIEGLNAGYSNIGFVGFPIVLAALGQEALVPATIGSIITMCVIFAATIVIVEVALQSRPSRLALPAKVGRTLIRNPILVASLSATAFPILGIELPAPAETFLKLLGGAAAPCALVALGLFLASKRQTTREGYGAAIFLAGCKLILHPLLAWLLARFVFHLPSFTTEAAVLLAALPAGTGSFMLAEFYRRDAQVSSRTIILSTLASIGTLSLCLTSLR
ncbi:AEC family transporter (plasmid) [Agrobacterium tumefaciens]|uniref:AEC family transporter n=1 Tax=Agrobacterium tumefaciens TaxID=358 RepID=UPI0015721ADF|nr:AEC family transporter [Agrobacterium tumefaciens]NSZ77504.1 AEC family transporter [Agrobacterium tumefaciens]NSZ87889.1 AEC family transporter [Agrobacterium tumefaciens]WCA72649.1 AEC family transporter [Agrobacterium tumefaciens]